MKKRLQIPAADAPIEVWEEYLAAVEGGVFGKDELQSRHIEATRAIVAYIKILRKTAPDTVH